MIAYSIYVLVSIWFRLARAEPPSIDEFAEQQ